MFARVYCARTSETLAVCDDSHHQHFNHRVPFISTRSHYSDCGKARACYVSGHASCLRVHIQKPIVNHTILVYLRHCDGGSWRMSLAAVPSMLRLRA
jgi:hypothetical protein